MSTAQTPGPVTDAELAALAQKLEDWARELSPTARATLGRLLIQAAASRSDAVHAFIVKELIEPAPTRGGGGTSPSPPGDGDPNLLAATQRIYSAWVTGYESYLGDLSTALARIVRTAL